MSTLPRLVSRKAHTERSMSRLRTDSSEGTGCEELESVPTEKETRAALARAETREAGIKAALAPAVAAGEGARVLVYGRTRWGKSAFARHLVKAALNSGVAGTVLIHDPKFPDHAQYEGIAVSELSFVGVAVQAGSVVVCRPPMSAADAAHASRLLSESGERTLLLCDETRRALGGSQIWCDGKNADGTPGPRSFEWICLEGGGLGASLVLLVQRPRQLPGDAVDSAQTHVVFGLGGRSLTYLVTAGTVPPEAKETIRRLPPGAFCVFGDDDDWDGRTYYSPE